MKHVVTHLRKDPVLAKALDRVTLTKLVPHTDYFSDLCETIINQQLSEKAGATIWKRFIALFPKFSPDKVLAMADKKIRASGISWSKISYIKNIARYSQSVDLRLLRNMENELVISELTKIKGIGQWTAEMFLMFSLGREDIFSYGDLGLKRAIQKLYAFKKEPTQKQMEKIVVKWSPYRTYACRILWMSL